MGAVLLHRGAQALASLVGASALVWSLLLLTPGDPAVRLLAANNVAEPTPEQIAATRGALDLDRPVLARYGSWLARATRGDLGVSWATGRPVREELGRRVPATVVLTVSATALALVLALALGCLAASFPWGWPDAAVRTASLALVVVPGFLLGTLLLDVVVVRWGRQRVVTDGTWATVLLPALTLSLPQAARWSRVLRAGLLEVRRAPFLETSAARGAGRARQLVRHALPNALVPVLTVVGTDLAGLLGGALVVETLFTWPGVGRWAVMAITARDVPAVQGFTLLAVVAYVGVSTLVDVVVATVDPRIRADGR